jgi:superfamily II DNA helicase RecQ
VACKLEVECGRGREERNLARERFDGSERNWNRQRAGSVVELLGRIDRRFSMASRMAIADAMQALGALHFRGKQDEAIEAVLSGADVFYVFPTGCGKSMVYQVAALCSEGVTIIVSPLLGLLNEQLVKMSSLGICVIGACGGTLDAYNGNIGATRAKMVYTTPEQLHEESELCKYLEKEQLHVARLVVDEAHVIQDWEEFR